MISLRLLGAGLLMLAGGVAYADPCKLTIDSNDLMRFNQHQLTVPTQCAEVEVTLTHSGKLPAKVMGHDWVLTRDADMSAIVNAALAAGSKNGYVPPGDVRVIAATKVVGGGESSTIKFSTAALQEGLRYVFFCTSPGHAAIMRGNFFFGSGSRVAQAK